MLTEQEIDTIIRRHNGDYAFAREIQPAAEWTLRYTSPRVDLPHSHQVHFMSIDHASGAYLRMELGSCYPHDREGNVLRGRSGGQRTFNYPSRALRALREAGALEVPQRDEALSS